MTKKTNDYIEMKITGIKYATIGNVYNIPVLGSEVVGGEIEQDDFTRDDFFEALNKVTEPTSQPDLKRK